MDAACLNSLLNMSDCLPYVQAGSATARPDAACCPELAGMVGSNPLCLCELLSGAADSYGIAVDYSRALALPGVCRVETPPVSTCAAFGYNVRGLAPSPAPMSGSPAPGPSGDSPQFPGTAPFPSPPAPRSHADRRSVAASTHALVAAFATGMMMF
ncbi:non-specific lipid transfer protein GPI-anchored 2-like [Lolium rigidum]|uniref:non-specific lipid transfer protein GPI-anchored 2-like n=1 Tax=Lolium rigidum TaxID=89674 RepID=UPI001F5D8287|nr:non-specific lipid transfer protein GPI-anchored 2-like [Lolium rigidum]